MYKLDKKTAINKTLELIDKPINEWITFNDDLNIKFIDNINSVSKNPFSISKDEELILESKIGHNYLLISTKKIYSIFEGINYEMNIFEFEGFGDEFDKINYSRKDGKHPKTNLISVKRSKSNNLLFEIDSFYPSEFVKMFIINICNYIKFGKWFWKNDR